MDQVLRQRWEVIDNIFGDTWYNTNNDEVLVFCPKHSHRKRKLSINIKKNAFRCWVCGYSGKKIFPLLYDYGNASQRAKYFSTLDVEFKEEDKDLNLELPEGFIFALSDTLSPTGMMVESYLREIGLSRQTILQSKIGFCSSGIYEGRVIFPSFDFEGKLNYFITRRVDNGGYKKYLDCTASKSSIIFNELFVDFSKPVVIVESVKTHFKHFSVPNVIPIMGTKLDESYKLFQEIVLRDCPRVYVAFDDEAHQQSVNLVHSFVRHGVDARHVTCKEQHDETSTTSFVQRLVEAKSLSGEDFLMEKIKSIC